jgi:hypothetical protein
MASVIERPGSGKIAPQITIQADVGGMSLAFVEDTSGVDEGKLRERVGIYRRVIDYARAQNSLVEALVDLQAVKEALASWDERRAAALKAVADEKIREQASYEAANQLGPRAKRTDGFTDQQMQNLRQFDAKRAAEAAKFDLEKENLEKALPRHEAQVARQRAIIAGRDRSEVIGPAFAAEAQQRDAAD